MFPPGPFPLRNGNSEMKSCLCGEKMVDVERANRVCPRQMGLRMKVQRSTRLLLLALYVSKPTAVWMALAMFALSSREASNLDHRSEV